MGIIIRKKTETRFSTQETDGVEISLVDKVWSENDSLHVKKPSGQVISANYADVEVWNIDDVEGTIYESIDDLLNALDTIGYANFNSGGATPQKAVYQITGQDSSGFSIVNERYNNTGTSFSFVRDDVGIFSIPEYDFVNMTLNAVIYKLDRESFWSGEDQKLFTRQPSIFSFVDDAFEFGGFIEIQVFEPLP